MKDELAGEQLPRTHKNLVGEWQMRFRMSVYESALNALASIIDDELANVDIAQLME